MIHTTQLLYACKNCLLLQPLSESIHTTDLDLELLLALHLAQVDLHIQAIDKY